jgi:hypothetical protein
MSHFCNFWNMCYNCLCLRGPRVKPTSGRDSTELVRFGMWSAVLDRLRTTFADFYPSLCSDKRRNFVISLQNIYFF